MHPDDKAADMRFLAAKAAWEEENPKGGPFTVQWKDLFECKAKRVELEREIARLKAQIARLESDLLRIV